MKYVTVVGGGYVGLSMACLLATHHHVTLLEISQEKVKRLKQKQSYISDSLIQEVLLSDHIHLDITSDTLIAYSKADYIIVAVPTHYDETLNFFDTQFVNQVIDTIYHHMPQAIVMIKSTVPVGYTKNIQDKYPTLTILFSPEFLREDHALYDLYYPSRIIMSGDKKASKDMANMLKDAGFKKDVDVLYTDTTNAEAIKLFSNTYLAMRIAFFNELDSYAELHQLDAKSMIKGVSLDPRIGQYYNNPSFGYGGYCLPKDTKQLLANYDQVPQKLIQAIVSSNETRKLHIVNQIISKGVKKIGFYRLTMKKDSDNMRASSMIDVLKKIIEQGFDVIIYEPLIQEDRFLNQVLERDLEKFKQESQLIVCNRYESHLEDVKEKVYTRDIFSSDT
jgi:UDPglucose 6-dehydrogenase